MNEPRHSSQSRVLYFWIHHCIFWPVEVLEIRLIQPCFLGNCVLRKVSFNWIVFLWGWLSNAIVILAYNKFGSEMAFYLHNGLSQPHLQGFFFSAQRSLIFKKDPTLVTLTAFLSLRRSIHAVYEKYKKYKKLCRQSFFVIFFSVLFI